MVYNNEHMFLKESLKKTVAYCHNCYVLINRKKKMNLKKKNL